MEKFETLFLESKLTDRQPLACSFATPIRNMREVLPAAESSRRNAKHNRKLCPRNRNLNLWRRLLLNLRVVLSHHCAQWKFSWPHIKFQDFVVRTKERH